MNILFNTANIKWNGSEYVEVVNVSKSEIVLDDCIVEDCDDDDDESDDE
jgi:hypothetical protein